jgi:hypothetical protein
MTSLVIAAGAIIGIFLRFWRPIQHQRALDAQYKADEALKKVKDQLFEKEKDANAKAETFNSDHDAFTDALKRFESGRKLPGSSE